VEFRVGHFAHTFVDLHLRIASDLEEYLSSFPWPSGKEHLQEFVKNSRMIWYLDLVVGGGSRRSILVPPKARKAPRPRTPIATSVLGAVSDIGDISPTINLQPIRDGKMSCGAYDGIRTICTEQRAWRATASETLPRKKRPSPVRP
jgi:hypothetical protein